MRSLRISPELWLDVATQFLDGEPLRWRSELTAPYSWNEFLLHDRFHKPRSQEQWEVMMSHFRQRPLETVEEYSKRFHFAAYAEHPQWPCKELAMSCFWRGLRPDCRPNCDPSTIPTMSRMKAMAVMAQNSHRQPPIPRSDASRARGFPSPTTPGLPCPPRDGAGLSRL